MPGEHNVLNATGAIAVAHELGIAGRGDRTGPRRLRRRQAPLHQHRRRGTASTIIDDYGHHPVEIAAVLKAARAVAARPGHRRRPAAPLHAPARPVRRFCTCFNDADTVIVAPVYPAGEAPIEGIDRDALVEGLRAARPSRCARRSTGRTHSPRLIAAIARPGRLRGLPRRRLDHPWAYALPDELAAVGPAVSGPTSDPRPQRRLSPAIRGRLTPNAPLAPYHLVPRRRPGATCCSSRRTTTTWRSSWRSSPPDMPVTVVGVGSNLLVRDGGVAGVVIRLSAKGFGQTSHRGGNRIRAGRGAARQGLAAFALDAGPRRFRVLSTASPARSAARCA